MYNKIILVGNLTRDVEIRYGKSGVTISNVGIATNRKFKSQDGEQKSEVMFIDLTFFGRTAEIANQYLKKGSKILVEGRLVLQQWTGQDGSKKSKHTVTVDNLQMLGGRNEENNSQSSYQPSSNNSQYSNQPSSNNSQYSNNRNSENNSENSNNNVSSVNDDEIPF